MNLQSQQIASIFLTAALAITAWGILGHIQSRHLAEVTYIYSPEYVVDWIEPGGPAESAGIQIGDRVLSVNGWPVEEIPMQSRRPHPRIGESRKIVFERDGQTMSANVVFAASSSDSGNLALGAFFVGLCLMGIGIWAVFSTHSYRAVLLGLIGLAGGVALTRGPDVGVWNGIPSHLQISSMLLLTILLFKFFATFPIPKRFASSRFFNPTLVFCWVLLLALQTTELIVHPRLYHECGNIASLLMLGFVCLTIIALIHTLISTPRIQLVESGMHYVYFGIIVAIVPTLVAVFTGFSLPGSRYVPLLIVAIPLSMALAIRKQSQKVIPMA